VNGERLRIGTRAFALGGTDAQADHGVSDDQSALQSVYLGSERGLLARFDIAEQVGPATAAAIDRLRADGIRITIASGDRAGPVRAVAQRLGISEWHHSMQPADKLALARHMQADGRIVGMVGDGINDSPVLAGADVAIAIGTGTALAQHAADCILMGNGPEALPEARALARRTMRVVRQNLWWAAGYNLVAVPLAVTGILAPWLAALGMSASSLLVTFNALRLGMAPRPASAPASASLSTGEVAP
jgi:Cu2+-exporting ATPase